MTKFSHLLILVLAMQFEVSAQVDMTVLPDSIASSLRGLQKDAKVFDALDLAVNYLFNEGSFLEAAPFIEEMVGIAEKSGDDIQKATACFYAGSIDILTDDLPDAYRQFMTAKLLLSHSKAAEGNELLLMRTNISLASYYMTTQSNYTEAYKCLTAAKELNKVVGSDGYEDVIDSYIIKVLNSLGLNEEAIRLGKKASASNDDVRKSVLYSNIASNYMDISTDTARIYLDSAFMLAQNRFEEAKIIYNIGLCDRKAGDETAAVRHFNKCLRSYPDALNHELTSLLLVEKGKTHHALHEYDSALIYINKGVATAHDYGFANIELDGRSCQCDILESRKDYRHLADCLKAYHHLKDSIDELNNADDVAYMMLEKQFKEAENQMARDSQANEMKRFRLVSIIIIVTFTLLAATAIFLLVLSRKRVILKNKELKEKALADELEKQNRKMMKHTLDQQQRQEIMSDIVGKLKEMNNDTEKNNKDINNMIGSLEDFSKLQTAEDFDYYFTKTHPDFYKNLSEAFPNLSMSELKLCAYIKLNMSPKDIANVCNVALSSVHQSRYRLKKSLGLDNADDIYELLAKY